MWDTHDLERRGEPFSEHVDATASCSSREVANLDGVVFQSIFPILTTPDLSRALGFYRDLLGGEVVYQFPGESEPAYVGIDFGNSHLGIGGDPTIGESLPGSHFALWVYVDDCDSAVEHLRANGVTVVEPPTDQPWGGASRPRAGP
jgi:uncharacterized glyoxalase superfamily protein PhnB